MVTGTSVYEIHMWCVCHSQVFLAQFCGNFYVYLFQDSSGRMAMGLPVKTKWSDSLNLVWIEERNRTIASRDSVANLYSRLLSAREVVVGPSSLAHLVSRQLVSLPDYSVEPLSTEELEHQRNVLLKGQLALARPVCSDSPFYSILQQRLIILQRIYYAVSTRYNTSFLVFGTIR